MAEMWQEEAVNDAEGGVDDDDDDDDDEDILDMGGADASQAGPNEAQQREALLMRFCPHDSSMLYPQVSKKSMCDCERLSGCMDGSR
jgi:hypothetical protein